MIKKVKNTVPWAYIASDLNGKKLLGRFRKTNCKKHIKKNLELKNKSKEKTINYVLNGKVIIVHFIVG